MRSARSPGLKTGRSPRQALKITVTVIQRPLEREAAFDIRRRVFQDEQGVPADEEFDADDDRAVHLLACVGATAVGTARILFHADYAKVGRMAVLREWRRHGVGRALLERSVGIAGEHAVKRVVLHAQVHAIPFYAALGFRIVGDEFLEARILHRRMERLLSPTISRRHAVTPQSRE